MYLLRTNVSTKLIDNDQFIEALFGYDPDPSTRQDFRPEEFKAEFIAAAESGDKIKYTKTHKLSSLKGSPGRSDTWSDEEYSIYRESSVDYGYAIYSAAESGSCLLRYSKLGDDGMSIITKIVFADPSVWYDSVEDPYTRMENVLQRHFMLEGTTEEITPDQYEELVTQIRADINDMKSGGTTLCRLDFINEVTN